MNYTVRCETDGSLSNLDENYRLLPINAPISDLNLNPNVRNWLTNRLDVTTIGHLIANYQGLFTLAGLGNAAYCKDLYYALEAKAVATEIMLRQTPSEARSGNYVSTLLPHMLALHCRISHQHALEIQNLRRRHHVTLQPV